jgi:hypothetical protein
MSTEGMLLANRRQPSSPGPFSLMEKGRKYQDREIR